MSENIRLRVVKDLQVPFNWIQLDGSVKVEFFQLKKGEIINTRDKFDQWKGYIATGHLEIIDD